MKRLGVNRSCSNPCNARGELHPDPFFAAKFVKNAGEILSQFIYEKTEDI